MTPSGRRQLCGVKLDNLHFCVGSGRYTAASVAHAKQENWRWALMRQCRAGKCRARRAFDLPRAQEIRRRACDPRKLTVAHRPPTALAIGEEYISIFHFDHCILTWGRRQRRRGAEHRTAELNGAPDHQCDIDELDPTYSVGFALLARAHAQAARGPVRPLQVHDLTAFVAVVAEHSGCAKYHSIELDSSEYSSYHSFVLAALHFDDESVMMVK